MKLKLLLPAFTPLLCVSSSQWDAFFKEHVVLTGPDCQHVLQCWLAYQQRLVFVYVLCIVI
jgi:hypothetical protein